MEDRYKNHGFTVGQIRLHCSGVKGKVISVTDASIPIITVESEMGCDRFIPRSYAAREWEEVAPENV